MACGAAVPAVSALGGQQLSLASSATRRDACKPAHQCSTGLPSRSLNLNAARALPLQQTSTSSKSFTRLSQAGGEACIKVSQRRLSIVAKVSETPVDGEEAVQDAVNKVKEAWEKVDDKLAIASLGFAALLALWASTGLIAAIDKLPVFPALFEFVGLGFTGWFVYRYLLFKPEREEFVKILDDAKSKITGQ